MKSTVTRTLRTEELGPLTVVAIYLYHPPLGSSQTLDAFASVIIAMPDRFCFLLVDHERRFGNCDSR